MEFNFRSRVHLVRVHETERLEREKGNPVRFLASQRTVIECKCNNRVATYYLRKLYFVFRVVTPLHFSFQPPPLGKRSIFNPLHVLLFYSPLPLGLQFTFAPSYYVEVQRPPILFSSRGMKWKTGHTCVEEDDLWIGEAWLARFVTTGFMLGDGFLAPGFVENWGSGANNPGDKFSLPGLRKVRIDERNFYK